jgi:hypothetical protein
LVWPVDPGAFSPGYHIAGFQPIAVGGAVRALTRNPKPETRNLEFWLTLFFMGNGAVIGIFRRDVVAATQNEEQIITRLASSCRAPLA